MTVLINDNFAADSSADYNGGGLTVTGGQANCTGADGFRRHAIEVAGDRWIRIRILDNTNLNMVVPGCSSGGNGFGIIFDATGANLIADWLSAYTAHTTYSSNDDDINVTIGTRNAANFIGITVDIANEILRFWNNTTAAEPTSLTSWDGAGPDATLDFTGLQTLGGNWVGFGTWDTSGTPAESYDDFSAGGIGGGGGGGGQAPRSMHQYQLRRA